MPAKDLEKALKKAEMKARTRDIENSKILSDEEMKLANELQEKANSRGMVLIPEKKHKNKARFVQLLQANLEYLRKHDYLTSEEKVFLFDIQPFIGLHSNAIVDDPKKKNATPVNISQLAIMLGRTRPKTSKIVNSLVDKGIIAKAESGIEGNNARAYALFLNPHIIFAGDKDSVNETLKAMFKKAMNKKILKNLPDKLF
jgi:predicted transcriptional regulator